MIPLYRGIVNPAFWLFNVASRKELAIFINDAVDDPMPDADVRTDQERLIRGDSDGLRIMLK